MKQRYDRAAQLKVLSKARCGHVQKPKKEWSTVVVHQRLGLYVALQGLQLWSSLHNAASS